MMCLFNLLYSVELKKLKHTNDDVRDLQIQSIYITNLWCQLSIHVLDKDVKCFLMMLHSCYVNLENSQKLFTFLWARNNEVPNLSIANNSKNPLMTTLGNNTLSEYTERVNILGFLVPHYTQGEYINDIVLLVFKFIVQILFSTVILL